MRTMYITGLQLQVDVYDDKADPAEEAEAVIGLVNTALRKCEGQPQILLASLENAMIEIEKDEDDDGEE